MKLLLVVQNKLLNSLKQPLISREKKLVATHRTGTRTENPTIIGTIRQYFYLLKVDIRENVTEA